MIKLEIMWYHDMLKMRKYFYRIYIINNNGVCSVGCKNIRDKYMWIFP